MHVYNQSIEMNLRPSQMLDSKAITTLKSDK